ncbi:MAG: tripartite tricarboxylate transporter permease [Rhizobiaceae bacterium]|nr:tripartite tricarboxylate transporter permease [Rhizobiaceae bacterium]
MNIFDNLLMGFGVALSWEALLYCFIGVTLGTFIGVLPGLGPMVTIGMLLPITYYLDPTSAIIMLAGIYYGSQYGNSTASILLNLPGTSAGAVTCLDGHPLALQGRAGSALFMTTIASFFGSCFGIIVLASLAPVLANFALQFGPTEYFALMLLGLIAAAILVRDSLVRGLVSVLLGLLLGLVGTDIYSGSPRFTFGFLKLSDGIGLVPIATGVFGVALIMANAGRHVVSGSTEKLGWRSMMPGPGDVKRSILPMFRGASIGSILGMLPGAGPTISTFIAYATEKKIARDPSRFGRGAIEGVAAPEASNNAASQTGFVPTLTLGVPGDPVMAVMLGALMIHGVPPGPMLLVDHAPLFWGLVASFFIGNLLLLILNIPLIGLWVQLLKVPYGLLYPMIISFVCIGVYSINNSVFDVGLVMAFGLFGYMMLLLSIEPAPMLLGFILAPMIEENFRRSLILSRGDFMTFVETPISGGLIALSALLLGWIIISDFYPKKTQVPNQDAGKENSGGQD